MLTTSDIYELIEARRRELGLSQAEVGQRAFNRNDNAAIQSLRRGSSPAFDTLSSLASALGLELYFGKPRSSVSGLSEDSSESDLSHRTALRAGYLPLPWHPKTRSKQAPPLAPHSAWLDASALLADNLRVVVPDHADVVGLPHSGVVCFVDAAANDRGKDGLWCFQDEGKDRLARIAFDKDIMVILSSNFSVSPRVLRVDQSNGVELLGRAVMIGYLPNLLNRKE